jgi:hypothetical protein
MPISGNELIFRRAALVSDTTPAQNGGRMTSAPIVSAVKNNLFPDVTQAQRLAGADHFRKVFLHVASAAETALLDARVFLEDVTPGDDFVLLYPGSHSDTQEAVIGRPYGVGRLIAPVVDTATELQVQFENADFATYRPIRLGDQLRVANMPSTGGNGSDVHCTVQAVVWAGAVATVTLADQIGTAFDPALGPVTVASIINLASVHASVSAPSKTSASGNFGGSGASSNRGSVLQNWTLTFTSSEAFRVDGDTLGASVANGNVSADFSPVNPSGGVYFSLPSSGWSGTWTAGDTLTFSTEPAAIPLWLRRVVPGGAGSIGVDSVTIGIQGESA